MTETIIKFGLHYTNSCSMKQTVGNWSILYWIPFRQLTPPVKSIDDGTVIITTTTQLTQDKKDRKAKGIMMHTVDTKLVMEIKRCENARMAWIELKKKFSESLINRQLRLTNAMYTLKMNGYDINTYNIKFDKIWDKLADCDPRFETKYG